MLFGVFLVLHGPLLKHVLSSAVPAPLEKLIFISYLFTFCVFLNFNKSLPKGKLHAFSSHIC